MYIPRGTRENPRIPRRIAARSTYGYQPKEDQMMGDQLGSSSIVPPMWGPSHVPMGPMGPWGGYGGWYGP